MPRAVLIRHELPDGSFHYDWMIQRPGGPDRPLMAFRVGDRIDGGVAPEFLAQRLADHRPAYLDYEGAVPGDRGRVLRLAAGTMAIIAETPERVVVEGRLGSASGRFEGSPVDGTAWRFRFTPEGAEPSPPDGGRVLRQP
jgi:hypothetical protein